MRGQGTVGATGPAGVSNADTHPRGQARGQGGTLPTAALNGSIVDYETHYRTRDVSAAQLWVDVSFLRQLNRFGEVERALQAYLKYHPKQSEPWMYLLLAVAFEINGRDPQDVRTALGWAGYLARIQGDPFTLIEVADILLLRSHFEIPMPSNIPPVRPGELLDLAADKAPNRAEPVLLSLLLAEKTTNPERMAATVERLMALGWPGVDEQWRQEARRRTEAQARKLEESGQSDPAKALLNRLRQAEVRDLFVRLTWKGDAGLDLVVEEPLGAKASYLEPRTVFGGAIVKSGRGKSPESVYTCPLAFDGDYKIHLDTFYNSEDDPARDIRMEIITHEGTAEEKHETKNIALEDKSPIVLTLKGGRRTRVLPFQAPTRLVVSAEVASEKPAGSTRPAPNTPASNAAKAAEALRSSTGRSNQAPSIRPEGESKSKASSR